jgi:phage/plasmid-like protein (TIGR03299 family)
MVGYCFEQRQPPYEMAIKKGGKLMAHNIDSMAYYGEVPWHGLGKRVSLGIKSEEMIRAAGLDWEVQMRPARGAKIDIKGTASRYELFRMPRSNSEQGELFPTLRSYSEENEILLGVVTKNYKPLQNVEAFSFFDPIIKQGKAYFETAGSLGQGERIWVMAKLPDIVKIAHNDECWKYLLLSNNHTGEGSVIVKFTMIRVVCQNTLMLSMEDGQKVFRIRHSKFKMFERLDDLTELIAQTLETYKRAEELFKKFVQIQMKTAMLDEYLEAIYPRNKVQKKETTHPEKWDHVKKLFEDNAWLTFGGIKGTLWAAYNAVTQFEDYRMPRVEEDGEKQLNRIWFGSSAEIKYKAFQKAQEFAKAS